MTIADRITEQVNRLDLENLSEQEREWLHAMRTLAQWVVIAQYYHEHKGA